MRAPEHDPPSGALLAGIGAFALAVALIGIPGRWLWLDELIGANLSSLGPWHTLLTSLRFETHPPLYYLGLSLWMLPAQNDAWLMAYSALWHAAGVTLLAHAAGRLHGRQVGLAAALLLSVSPAILAYATQVRMYAFIVFMMVWAWYAQARWLAGQGGRLGVLWMMLPQAIVANSHSAGLAMLSGVVLLGAATALQTGNKGLMLRWLLAEAAVGLLAVPGFAIAVLREMDNVVPPKLEGVLAVWTFLSGAGGNPTPIALALGAVVLAVLLAGAARDRQLAISVATLVLAPIGLAVIVSYSVRPMWIERLFVPVIPFLCVCLSRALLQAIPGPAAGRPTLARPGIGRAGFAALALCWGVLGLYAQFTRPKGDGHRLAALALAQQARPGDTIVIGHTYTFWGFLWYFDGPHWGDPLRAYVLTPAWESMFRRAPAAVSDFLGPPATDAVREVGGVRVVLWDTFRQAPPSAPGQDLFLVRLQGPSEVTFPGRTQAGQQRFMQFVVERWVPAGS